MKLCVVTPAVIRGDGQGRANYEIVWEAIRQGHEVTLVASQVEYDLQQQPQVDWIAIPIKQYPLALIRDLVFIGRSTAWLHRHRQEFDLIQVYGTAALGTSDINTAQFSHNAWLQSPVHTCRQQRNFYGFYQWLHTTCHAYWEKQTFQRTKQAIAVADIVKQELINIGVPAKNIAVIHNGVDLAEFYPGSLDRRQFNLPPEVPLALFAGDIRLNRKNLDTVLRALVQVPKLHVAVIGALERSPYPQMATELGVSNRVHFLGFRQDIAQIMRAVDFFVFPTRYEPFGMVVLEAMATELPVITTAIAGVAELMTPESGIVLPDTEDAEALAAAMSRLIQDPDLRQRMGKAGAMIAQQHSWSSKARCYIDLFETYLKP
jgi:glycosyltransferase involved in cell wall biosynthesis